VGGLGVEDKQNDLRGIYFSKLRTLDELEQQFRDMVFLMSEGNLLTEPVSSMLQKCVQNAGAHVQILY
jgi:hypothetical protein